MSSNVLYHGYVKLVDKMGSDLSIVNAARVSYDKESIDFKEKDEKLLNFLIREKHTSPFRHAAMTFEIYAPLFVARQWWKYAVASSHLDDQNGWNESSRRYITESELFYIPADNQWRSAPENSKQGSGDPVPLEIGSEFTTELINTVVKGTELYNRALQFGIAPEQARLFLPAYGLYVRWRWTASLQSILTFLEQRLGHDAQVEIQEYAKEIAVIIRQEFPETYKAFELGV